MCIRDRDRFNEMLMKSGNLLQTDPEIHDLLEAEDISAVSYTHLDVYKRQDPL